MYTLYNIHGHKMFNLQILNSWLSGQRREPSVAEKTLKKKKRKNLQQYLQEKLKRDTNVLPLWMIKSRSVSQLEYLYRIVTNKLD